MLANAVPTPRAPSSSLHGRRPQPAPALDLHAWADGWSLSTTATTTSRAAAGPSALVDDPVSPTSLAPQPAAAAGRGFGAAGSRPGSVALPLGAAPTSSSSFASHGQHASSPTKPATAFEGFALDRDRAPHARKGGRDEVYHRMRENSLELSLGDLPKPAPFLRAAANARPYPSPVSPSSRLCFVDKAPSCYFDPAHLLAAAAAGPASKISRDEFALPASPALVPLDLGHAEPSWSTLSAPRVEPSTTHPLHHAKRLSMTPLSSTKALPPVDAPTADLADMAIDEPPKVRKSSIVDLPLPQAAGGNGLPFSPPLTPPTVSAPLGPARTSKRQRRP
ncbi:hypothetical protein JCM3775_003633 [Rhodotorula graminis]|uniref:Uncharacterized protein n=1 Tax=Rhodotorula graminis (strain WP1) TaxID=578459 RepID=A0A194S128_RHOGW|nr:uncharacterized protein RHOBADRAFT_54256 [Rhodotorula graminis WP1]KPV74433.1 hypothetical protein RHOBADRAFT_54256 [Rhodotorula graminis WP1]